MSYSNLKRDQYGKWTRKTKWEFVIFWIFFIGTVGAYIGKVNAGSSTDASRISNNIQGQVERSGEMAVPDCTRIAPGSYSCSTKENLLKWQEYLESEVEKLKVEAGKPTAILTKVCRTNGITDSNCPKILYAMALQESGMGKWMEGDNGRSHGYFHILDIHKLSKSCTHDLECSANWSLQRMIRLGFNENRDNAIRLHNGGLNNPMTLAYLQAVKKKMNLWPI